MRFGMDMLIWAAGIAFLLSCSGLISALSEPKQHFMSREVTCTINGLFIMVVFFSHLRQYIPQDAYGPLDQQYLGVMKYLGQLMVATFLFFSGYGIMESIKRKDFSYVFDFPRKRILPFLLDVWIALIPFFLLRLLRHNPPALDDVLLSMVGWRGIGNSNWYIFAILVMYLATYVSSRMARHHRWLTVLLVCLVCAAYCKVMISQQAGKWYYDTIFCYPAGMAWSLLLDDLPLRIVVDTRLSLIGNLFVLLLLIGVFLLLKQISVKRALIHNVCAVSFALVVVFAYRLLPANGRPFTYLGSHLFYCYIYQRIPMILFQDLSVQPVLYSLVCLVTLIPLCWCTIRIHNALKTWIFAQPA